MRKSHGFEILVAAQIAKNRIKYTAFFFIIDSTRRNSRRFPSLWAVGTELVRFLQCRIRVTKTIVAGGKSVLSPRGRHTRFVVGVIYARPLALSVRFGNTVDGRRERRRKTNPSSNPRTTRVQTPPRIESSR